MMFFKSIFPFFIIILWFLIFETSNNVSKQNQQCYTGYKILQYPFFIRICTANVNIYKQGQLYQVLFSDIFLWKKFWLFFIQIWQKFIPRSNFGNMSIRLWDNIGIEKQQVVLLGPLTGLKMMHDRVLGSSELTGYKGVRNYGTPC